MSLLYRKKDLAYLVFFAIHIPIMFCVDLYPLYPESSRPEALTSLRTWYITTYNDKFFTAPPAWFTAYMWMELLYHVPLSVWAVGALIRNDPKVPIHLLVYAVQTAITTVTCIADYMSWAGYTNDQKIELGKLYVPYLCLSVYMGVDMYTRLDAALSKRSGAGGKKTN